MPFDRDEIDQAVRRYIATRDEVCAGKGSWDLLAQFFTDDAVFVDPAWGRVEGLDAIRESVLGPAMAGLDDWTFPTDFYAIADDGETVVVKWRQQFPGSDGRLYEQSGCSTLVYAGDGKFRYEEDLLNMGHALEDMKASGWRPTGPMHAVPERPNRDFSRPES